MVNTGIAYEDMVQNALRGVIRQVLQDVARDGLPGEHHLYITFETTAEGVQIPPYLHERYPDEMTIILQHQFWGLKVHDHAFEVGLSFSNKPETLVIPFAAVVSFLDPSVPFGLQLKPRPADSQAPEAATDNQPSASALPAKTEPAPVPAPATQAADGAGEDEQAAPDQNETPRSEPDEPEAPDNVVKLDVFRKK